MSNVKIQGNPSGTGTLTIAAPNTNSDYTLNLPASAGTVPVLASVTNNGVVYVNGSGQTTSGSALTFDGTSLQAAAARGTYALKIYNSSDGSVAGNFGALTGNVFAIDATGPANTMTFLTGGTERMRLDASGNLGIGATASTRLYVAANNPTRGIIHRVVNGSTSGQTGSQMQFTQAAIADWAIGQPAGQNAFAFWTGRDSSTADGTEVGRFDSSGNLLVGTTTRTTGVSGAETTLTLRGNASGNAASFVSVNNAGTGSGFLGTAIDNNTYLYAATNNALIFGTNNTERARITSAGRLLVGTTAALGDGVSISGTQGDNFWYSKTNTTGAYNQLVFANPNGNVGFIQTGGTGTSYNTSSDYRLKEDVQPMTGALAKVAALKPCTYKWKADGSEGEGFIAHELAEVVPQCVTGEKDAVDAEGKPVYQGIDTSFLVATLTAAIQEQQAIITALTARIEALEAK